MRIEYCDPEYYQTLESLKMWCALPEALEAADSLPRDALGVNGYG